MLYIKSLHIIFIVTWFAGLFYIVRLFIYHVEASDKEEPEKSILKKQFIKMEKLLWNVITAPSMILAIASGSYLAYITRMYTQSWLQIKVLLVVGLVFYHFACLSILKKLAKDEFKYSSFQLRLWNEVATLFLVSIVFLVVLKSTLSLLWGMIGLVLFAFIMMLIVKLYKKFRESGK